MKAKSKKTLRKNEKAIAPVVAVVILLFVAVGGYVAITQGWINLGGDGGGILSTLSPDDTAGQSPADGIVYNDVELIAQYGNGTKITDSTLECFLLKADDGMEYYDYERIYYEDGTLCSYQQDPDAGDCTESAGAVNPLSSSGNEGELLWRNVQVTDASGNFKSFTSYCRDSTISAGTPVSLALSDAHIGFNTHTFSITKLDTDDDDNIGQVDAKTQVLYNARNVSFWAVPSGGTANNYTNVLTAATAEDNNKFTVEIYAAADDSQVKDLAIYSCEDDAANGTISSDVSVDWYKASIKAGLTTTQVWKVSAPVEVTDLASSDPFRKNAPTLTDAGGAACTELFLGVVPATTYKSTSNKGEVILELQYDVAATAAGGVSSISIGIVPFGAGEHTNQNSPSSLGGQGDRIFYIVNSAALNATDNWNRGYWGGNCPGAGCTGVT